MISRTQVMAGRRSLTAVAVTVVLAALLAAAGHARASTVSGQITGAAIPAAGVGEAFVRAVDLQTGAIAAVDGADARGRYRMTVPKGAFALFPTVVTVGKVFSPKPTKVRLKRGQRRTVTLRARQTSVVLRPVFALPDSSFTGGTGEFRVLNKGLRDMLITDLLGAKTATCRPVFVERSKQFTDAYALELSLLRRGLLDPATAIRPGQLINPTRGIRGTIRVSGGRMRITAETYRWSNGKTLHRTSVEGPQEQFFALELVLARRLAALLCKPPPPVGGTFTGSLDYSKAITEGNPDTYRLALDGNLAQIPTVLSDCPPGQETSNGRTGVWPLLGIGLLPFTQTPELKSEGVLAGSATGSTPGTDDGYSWTWNLQG